MLMKLCYKVPSRWIILVEHLQMLHECWYESVSRCHQCGSVGKLLVLICKVSWVVAVMVSILRTVQSLFMSNKMGTLVPKTVYWIKGSTTWCNLFGFLWFSFMYNWCRYADATPTYAFGETPRRRRLKIGNEKCWSQLTTLL